MLTESVWSLGIVRRYTRSRVQVAWLMRKELFKEDEGTLKVQKRYQSESDEEIIALCSSAVHGVQWPHCV